MICLLPGVRPVDGTGLSRLELHEHVAAGLPNEQNTVAPVHDGVPEVQIYIYIYTCSRYYHIYMYITGGVFVREFNRSGGGMERGRGSVGWI